MTAYQNILKEMYLQVPEGMIDGLDFAMFPYEVAERRIGQAFLNLVVRVHYYPLASLSRDMGGPACNAVATEILTADLDKWVVPSAIALSVIEINRWLIGRAYSSGCVTLCEGLDNIFLCDVVANVVAI